MDPCQEHGQCSDFRNLKPEVAHDSYEVELARVDKALAEELKNDANPVVKQSTTTTKGRVKLEGLDAPGVYYLVENLIGAGSRL